MTGQGIYEALEKKADVNYSSYISPTDANQYFAEAFVEAIQEIYRDRLNEQNSFDELSYLIATGQQFNINSTTNTMYLGSHLIPLLMIWNVGTTVTVTSSIPHDLITGTRIQFANLTSSGGNLTTLNGQIYAVTVIDPFTFTFTSNFTIAPAGTFLSGEIVFPDSIPQYFHLLRGEAQFTQLTPFIVVDSTNATPIKITLNKRTYLRDKDQVVIAGIGGNTNANGTFFLKYANEFQYLLYADEKLTIPVIGNGTQTGTGTVSEIFKSSLRFKRSDEKGSVYGKPTVQSPFYQQSLNLIKILPDNEPCNWIKLDYIRVPPFQIDVTNNTDDLTSYYNLPFQYLILNRALNIFFKISKDGFGVQTSQNEVIDNK